MRHDFFPDREAEMLQWARNFLEQSSLDPQAYGLTTLQVEQFSVAYANFAEAYRVALAPETRTRPAIIAKNDTRRALEAIARSLSACAQGAGITDEQRALLGLSFRNRGPRRLPVPEHPPRISVTRTVGNMITVRLTDVGGRGRARPDGVAGAMVYVWTGEMPPVDVREWTFRGNHSSTQIDLAIDAPPFTKVWITACWYNPRGEQGPGALPIATYTLHGGPIAKQALAA